MSRCTVCLLCWALLAALLTGCGGQAPMFTTQQVKALASAPLDYLKWTEYANNPVVGPSSQAAFPFVLHEDGQFTMWTHNDSQGGIFVQTSGDGKQWSTPVECTGLARGARNPRVLRNTTTGQYEIWYWDNSNDFSIGALRHALSSNGIGWSADTGLRSAPAPNRPVYHVWGAAIGSRGACAVFHDPAAPEAVDYVDVWNNRYVMYYHVLRMSDDTDCIGLAVSKDGITWGVPVEGAVVLAPTPGAWDGQHASFGSIFRDSSGFHMYYAGGRGWYRTGGEGIGYASSSDGLVWTKASDPIMSLSDGVAWRSHYLGPSSALVADGQPMLFVYGQDAPGRYAVGLATMDVTPPDLVPPVLTLNLPSDSLLSPANGRTVPVTITGSASDEGSGLASVALSVEDEYGLANQTIDLLGMLVPADGSFSQVVELAATCDNADADGHQYRLTLRAADALGNAAQPLRVTVTAGKPSLAGDGGVGPGNGAGNGNGYGIGNGVGRAVGRNK